MKGFQRTIVIPILAHNRIESASMLDDKILHWITNDIWCVLSGEGLKHHKYGKDWRIWVNESYMHFNWLVGYAGFISEERVKRGWLPHAFLDKIKRLNVRMGDKRFGAKKFLRWPDDVIPAKFNSYTQDIFTANKLWMTQYVSINNNVLKKDEKEVKTKIIQFKRGVYKRHRAR